MKKIFLVSVIFLLFFTHDSFSQIDKLQKQIEDYISLKNAKIGVALYGFDTKEAIEINGDQHFPMQSVFKFHIALAVLDEVDKNNLSLPQLIAIPEEDLIPGSDKWWSPMRKDYPDGDITLPLNHVLTYTVSESDNNGSDALLKLIGGPSVVLNYIHSIGVDDFNIQYNEKEMHQDWNYQFQNWTTPVAATSLLKLFFERKILSKECHDFLLKVMQETKTGQNRIRGQLPFGTIVAHKTGSSGTSDFGVIEAANDIGIVELPNGEHFAISVFITNSYETEEENNRIISTISKMVWDYYLGGR